MLSKSPSQVPRLPKMAYERRPLTMSPTSGCRSAKASSGDMTLPESVPIQLYPLRMVCACCVTSMDLP